MWLVTSSIKEFTIHGGDSSVPTSVELDIDRARFIIGFDGTHPKSSRFNPPPPPPPPQLSLQIWCLWGYVCFVGRSKWGFPVTGWCCKFANFREHGFVSSICNEIHGPCEDRKSVV